MVLPTIGGPPQCALPIRSFYFVLTFSSPLRRGNPGDPPPQANSVRQAHGGLPITRQRASYSQSFKMEVVRTALKLPPTARIKPTSRAYPGIEPAQIRRWIRSFGPLVAAGMQPTTI